MSDSSESKYYADGDTLTVKRGKFANKTGKVLAKNLDGRYVVKLDDGNVTLVEPHNTKEPAEKTFTETQLVTLLQEAADQEQYENGAISYVAIQLGLHDKIKYRTPSE